MKTMIAAGIVGLMAISSGAYAQDSVQSDVHENIKADYICLPMPIFQMLTSDGSDSNKPKAPEFFLYNKDGRLTETTSNLGDMMKPKEGQRKSNDNSCGMKDGKGKREGMMLQPGREPKFVLIRFDEFSTLYQQKAYKLEGKCSNILKEMLDGAQLGKNTVDATVDGKNVKVFMMKPDKHGPKWHGDKQGMDNHCHDGNND